MNLNPGHWFYGLVLLALLCIEAAVLAPGAYEGDSADPTPVPALVIEPLPPDGGEG